MYNKILSVSIAAYNVEKTLKQALEPFTDPKVRDAVEIIIVNDGSTDSTEEIAKEYQLKFPGTFRLLSKENGGWGSTLNAAIEVATGKYFKQLDGDDYFYLKDLPEFISFLNICEADLACTLFAVFEDETNGLKSIESRVREFKDLHKTLSIKEMGKFMPAMHATTFKTSMLKESGIKITEHCFYTDLEFVIKAYNHSSTFAYLEIPVYMYRIGRDGQSMSVTGIRKHYLEHLKILKECLEYLEHEVRDPYKYDAIRSRISKACTMQYMFFYALKCNRKQKSEFMQYDRMLMEKYPYFFKEAGGGKRLKILRKTHFFGYWLLGHTNTYMDKKEKKHIFEGY